MTGRMARGPGQWDIVVDFLMFCFGIKGKCNKVPWHALAQSTNRLADVGLGSEVAARAVSARLSRDHGNMHEYSPWTWEKTLWLINHR